MLQVIVGESGGGIGVEHNVVGVRDDVVYQVASVVVIWRVPQF